MVHRPTYGNGGGPRARNRRALSEGGRSEVFKSLIRDAGVQARLPPPVPRGPLAVIPPQSVPRWRLNNRPLTLPGMRLTDPVDGSSCMSLENKLALKDRPIEVIDAPPGFPLRSSKEPGADSALLVFVVDAASLGNRIGKIASSALEDRLTWVAYPKGGQLGTDLNRDSLAALLLGKGVRPVTQIAIDATWSALRFRPGGSR